jgi:hypothetical protein
MDYGTDKGVALLSAVHKNNKNENCDLGRKAWKGWAIKLVTSVLESAWGNCEAPDPT